jgi:hypothetical protein
MARFVTVEVGCDWADCGTRAPEGDPEISTVELSIDRKQGREFLLCTKHRETFDETVLPLMAAGVKVTTNGGAKRSTGPSAEPVHPDHPDANLCKAETDGVVCGRPIRKRTGMAQHVIRTHGFESLEAYEAVHGVVT